MGQQRGWLQQVAHCKRDSRVCAEAERGEPGGSAVSARALGAIRVHSGLREHLAVRSIPGECPLPVAVLQHLFRDWVGNRAPPHASRLQGHDREWPEGPAGDCLPEAGIHVRLLSWYVQLLVAERNHPSWTTPRLRRRFGERQGGVGDPSPHGVPLHEGRMRCLLPQSAGVQPLHWAREGDHVRRRDHRPGWDSSAEDHPPLPSSE